jgi:hypothetical protein
MAGVSPTARDELVDDAIHVAVMSRNPVNGEEHLRRVFWTSIRLMVLEQHSGRHEVHVGSRRRVELNPLAPAPHTHEPFDLAVEHERTAMAVDLMAQLDSFERRVFALMATEEIGEKRTAEALGEPLNKVLAASRSAQRKLEQVAVIAAAGRMCDYRARALEAYAHGTAHAEQERAARAHLDACASCRASYARLLRELSGHEFQRAACAALLPPPAIAAEVHGRWVERLAALLSSGRTPSGGGTGAAGLLGGGGLVKAAAASTALVIAGAGVGDRVIHSLASPARVQHHQQRATAPSVKAHASGHVTAATYSAISPTRSNAAHALLTHRKAAKHTTSRPTSPPSRDLGYLALGASSGSSSQTPHTSPVARLDSTRPASKTAPAPTHSGGGSNLSYLGH